MTALRLVLMRHAKSSWKTGKADHQRPLNGRGRKAAPKVGAALRERGWVPDEVLSSDSTRTRETFARMREALGFAGEPRFEPALYHAGVEETAPVLRGATGRCVLLLGHNPGWEEVLTWLSRREEAMKTGCAALLSLEAPSWPRAVDAAGGWTLHDVLYPREL